MKTTLIAVLAVLFSVSAFAKKDCDANYTHNSTNFTGWKFIDKVDGLNKKAECKKKSIDKGPSIVRQNLSAVNLPALSAANWNGYCDGGIKIYVDTQVEGKKNSKDGEFMFKATCTKGNGPCIRYSQVFDRGSF